MPSNTREVLECAYIWGCSRASWPQLPDMHGPELLKINTICVNAARTPITGSNSLCRMAAAPIRQDFKYQYVVMNSCRPDKQKRHRAFSSQPRCQKGQGILRINVFHRL